MSIVTNTDSVIHDASGLDRGVKVYNAPPGHLGNLSASQKKAFDTLKKLIIDELGYDGTQWYDDKTVIRFLRARNFLPLAALEQLIAADKWRKGIRLEELYKSCDGDEMNIARQHYPRWTGRRDKAGRPIFVFRLASLDRSRQKQIAAPQQETERLAVLSEFMIKFLLEMCCDLFHSNVERADKVAQDPTLSQLPLSEVVSIIDFENTSLAHLWKLRGHLQLASTLASAYFPETLGKMALVNVPPFFSYIWSWIQNWFDEGTRNKMVVIDSRSLKSRKNTLTELVASVDLPIEYGGDLPWVYEDEPLLDCEIRDAIGTDMLPKGPLIWQNGKMMLLRHCSDAPISHTSS